MKRGRWPALVLAAIAVIGPGIWLALPYLLLHGPVWIARIVDPVAPNQAVTRAAGRSTLAARNSQMIPPAWPFLIEVLISIDRPN